MRCSRRGVQLVRVGEVPGGVVVGGQVVFVVGAEEEGGGVTFAEAENAHDGHADHERQIRQ